MRIMKKHEVREECESAAINGGVAVWPPVYFKAEARAAMRERQKQPYLRCKVKAGDRVSFDLGDGVDGPLYATNVRVIEPD
jgi:hypothetical protein